MKIILLVCALAVCRGADLTGNWLATTPNGDGTFRRTWLHLKQAGEQITGTIRTTQFFYTTLQSSGGPERYTLNASTKLEDREFRATYEVSLSGDELSVIAIRNN